ncbi:MAG: hypothetical protein GEU89_16280 [Kiloniellaceae bacterium]|nr:hypothetical protein [Kiloniellaceae bacterium]
MLASRKHGTLYIGITNDIARRVGEHRQGLGSRFVQKYRVTRVVYVEPYEEVERAIQREQTMKEWPRAWKIRLIERADPSADSSCKQGAVHIWVPAPSAGTTAFVWRGRVSLPHKAPPAPYTVGFTAKPGATGSLCS